MSNLRFRGRNKTLQPIGDSVITKRLMARGINVQPCPTYVTDGFRGKLGRINYVASIDTQDEDAVAALAEEVARREAEIAKRQEAK